MEYVAIGLSVVTIILVVVVIALLFKRKGESGVNIDTNEIARIIKAEDEKMLNDIGRYLSQSIDIITKNIELMSNIQKERLENVEKRIYVLNENVVKSLQAVRDVFERSVEKIRSSNEKELKEMREVVDEKLSSTLENRLNKSFNIINERLEAVYKGLGEMQGLAKGVGDLKKVLTNVKTRGTWGEVQLDNLLSQILTSGQYERNVRINPRLDERVDFAIKLPGKEHGEVLLPIDAKFPLEEYQRIISASENMDKAELEKNKKGLENRIKEEARSISSKYILPPRTTDFAILYLPLESLYAEVLKREGLVDNLQRDYRIVICGPTTLGALLNSLQMGFKTVAIETRSRELWNLLAVFKNEFNKFTEVLQKTERKLSEAGDTLSDVTKKTMSISKKLNNVDSIAYENNLYIED